MDSDKMKCSISSKSIDLICCPFSRILPFSLLKGPTNIPTLGEKLEPDSKRIECNQQFNKLPLPPGQVASSRVWHPGTVRRFPVEELFVLLSPCPTYLADFQQHLKTLLSKPPKAIGIKQLATGIELADSILTPRHQKLVNHNSRFWNASGI